MFTQENPAVRVEAAWNKPSTTRVCTGSWAMGPDPSLILVSEWIFDRRMGAYIKNDKEQQVESM